MKHPRLMLAAVTLLSAVAFSSCSLYDYVFKSDKSKLQRDSVLPTDRETVGDNTGNRTYDIQELKNGVIKGDWAIEEVYGQPAMGEEAPYLRFEPTEKAVYGNNGCNAINARYDYNSESHMLTFSQIATTMRLCHTEGITDTQICVALEATRYYDWEAIDSQYYIYFYNENHSKVLTLMHQNFEFLNGTWKVTAIDGEPVFDDDMKMVIDVDEGKLHGYTGCNTMNGTLEIDMTSVNSISFQAFAVTRMACGPDSLETPLLVALEEADHAKPVSKDKVELINSQGRVVLTLQRTSDK